MLCCGSKVIQTSPTACRVQCQWHLVLWQLSKIYFLIYSFLCLFIFSPSPPNVHMLLENKLVLYVTTTLPPSFLCPSLSVLLKTAEHS